jgi:hypothetical protein
VVDLVSPHLKSCSGFDRNEAMLEVAKVENLNLRQRMTLLAMKEEDWERANKRPSSHRRRRSRSAPGASKSDSSNKENIKQDRPNDGSASSAYLCVENLKDLKIALGSDSDGPVSIGYRTVKMNAQSAKKGHEHIFTKSGKIFTCLCGWTNEKSSWFDDKTDGFPARLQGFFHVKL